MIARDEKYSLLDANKCLTILSRSSKSGYNLDYYLVSKHCLTLYIDRWNSHQTTKDEDLRLGQFLNDVLIPEAIVKAITIIYECDWIRAEQLFTEKYG